MKIFGAFFVFVMSIVNAENTFTVSGKITNANNESLPYVNVYLKRTTKGAVSREDGKYIYTPNQERRLFFGLRYALK